MTELDDFIPGASVLLKLDKAPPIIIVFLVASAMKWILTKTPHFRTEWVPHAVMAISTVMLPALSGAFSKDWTGTSILTLGLGMTVGAFVVAGREPFLRPFTKKKDGDTDLFLMKPKILVVDDDEEYCKLIEWGLPCCEISYVLNSAGALTWLRGNDRPSSVIVDLRMPGMGGVDLIKAIHMIHPGLPCLILSGIDVTQVQIDDLLNSTGAIEFMRKGNINEHFYHRLRLQLRVKLN